MADVKWIKITTDIFDDEKILLIESMPDAYAIITVWFKLLCLAGKMNNSGVFMMSNQIAYTDKMLATIFRMNELTVKLALSAFQDFGMIEIIDGVITIPNWDKHQSLDAYEQKKERDRIYQAERRRKQKLLVDKSSDKSSDSKTIESSYVAKNRSLEEDKEKDIDIDKNNNICASDNAPSEPSSPSMKEVNAFFEAAWKLYPNKKGKGQISDTKKKKLFEVGIEEMTRAIDRYNAELKKDADWRKPQNGSTFFNSGYVDYLDDNYTPSAKIEAKPKFMFNSYQQSTSNEQLDELENLFLDEVNMNTDAFNQKRQDLQDRLKQKYGKDG